MKLAINTNQKWETVWEKENSKNRILERTSQHLLNVKTLEKLDDRELTRAIRDAIISEEEAIKQYETIVDSSDNPKIKSILQEISNEERVHVGELQTLLEDLLKDEKDFILEGKNEVKNR